MIEEQQLQLKSINNKKYQVEIISDSKININKLASSITNLYYLIFLEKLLYF